MVGQVRFDRVSKRFGESVVIETLDLTIEAGEFFTLVGPSGCGKSTALSLLAGLERPSAGSVRFDGKPVDDLPPGERDVAMVFQSYALYPHLSVFENIAFPLRVRKMGRATVESAVREVAETLGLGALLGRRPRELSGGQRQRVALGRALVRRPALFLLDEPLSNLDARLRLEMREELKRLHRQYATTTVYVTHDQEEAMVLSDRIAVMEAGRVRQIGPPKEVYGKPVDLFVAGFIGSPPINLLEPVEEAGHPLEGDPSRLVLGVRPPDVTLFASRRERALAAKVVMVEPTGSDTWVVVQYEGQRIKGRAVEDAIPGVGDDAYLHVAPTGILRFERESGRRLD